MKIRNRIKFWIQNRWIEKPIGYESKSKLLDPHQREGQLKREKMEQN